LSIQGKKRGERGRRGKKDFEGRRRGSLSGEKKGITSNARRKMADVGEKEEPP